jgi:putative ABC transport system permease protein
MAALSLIYRLIFRRMLGEPARSLLIVLAVAVGVAVVLAIDLAGNAATSSFHSSLETLAGDNDLEVTATGGVPGQIVGLLDTLPYPLHVSPRIEDHATVAGTGETVPLIGVDLIGEIDNRQDQSLARLWNADSLEHINDPDAVWTTRPLGKKAGDKLSLLIDDRTRDYIVRGIIPDSANLGGDVVVMDIAAAQAATGKNGRVDRILLKVPAQPSFDFWRQRLRAALPAGVQLNPQGSQTDANRRMLAAFRWNLRILSYVALLVGAFLIYNTISVSVVRRRAEIGTARALGASRRAVLWAFLAEAVVFGVAGSLLALPLGRLLASGAVRLLAVTVNALYISSRPGSMALSPVSIALAFVVGVGASVVSALAPAREASLVPPTEAMARGRREYVVRVKRARDAWFSLALAALSLLAARMPAIDGKPLFGYLAVLLLIGAASFAIPGVAYWLTSAASEALGRWVGVEAMLAARSLGGSLRRTSVLVATLSVAIAMMTSVGIMVGSFRQTVIDWMSTQLPADLYLRPAGDPAADRHPTISPDLTAAIAKLPGVETVSRFRAYEIEYQNMPVTLAAIETNAKHFNQGSAFVSGRPAPVVLSELEAGNAAMVSEPFANKHHVKAGDSITLPLGEKLVRFRIIDVFYDYGNERGFIALDWATAQRYLPGITASNLAVYLAPGAGLATVRQEIERVAAHRNVLIFSNRELRHEAIRIFDQTFAITYALEAIAVVVAVMGIAGALVSIVIDRRREFGILRYLGAATSQIRKLILMEAAWIGLLANIAGLILGFLLSLILIYVINKQSFGWTIRFHLPLAILAAALAVVDVATVLAGIYPARIARCINPIEVVHEE